MYWLTWDHGPAIQFRWHAFLMQFWTPEGLSLGHKWLELSSVVPFLVWCIHVTERYWRPGPQLLEHGLHCDTSHLQKMNSYQLYVFSKVSWLKVHYVTALFQSRNHGMESSGNSNQNFFVIWKAPLIFTWRVWKKEIYYNAFTLTPVLGVTMLYTVHNAQLFRLCWLKFIVYRKTQNAVSVRLNSSSLGTEVKRR